MNTEQTSKNIFMYVHIIFNENNMTHLRPLL